MWFLASDFLDEWRFKFQIEVPWTSEITFYFSQVQLFEPLALWAIRCSMSLSDPAGMPLTGDLGESWLQQIVPKRVVFHSRAGMCKRGFPISRAKSYNPQMTERIIRLSSLIHTKKINQLAFFWGGHWQKSLYPPSWSIFQPAVVSWSNVFSSLLWIWLQKDGPQ